MSDTAARAREQRIAEIKKRAKQFAVDHNWWSDSDPVVDDLTAFAESELQLAAQSAPVEQDCDCPCDICAIGTGKHCGKPPCDIPSTCAVPIEEVAREIAISIVSKPPLSNETLNKFYEQNVANLTEKFAAILRQHGYGAQPTIEQLYEAAKVIYSGDTRKDLFALEGLALHRHRDTGEMKYLVEALECRVTLKDFDSKFPDPLGAQGQGAGPRCPKCSSDLSGTSGYMLQVFCRKCDTLFPVNHLSDFAQFFSPVPSPESATKEGK